MILTFDAERTRKKRVREQYKQAHGRLRCMCHQQSKCDPVDIRRVIGKRKKDVVRLFHFLMIDASRVCSICAVITNRKNLPGM